MKLYITDTTDGKNLGITIEDTFPVMLGNMVFAPDTPPILIGAKVRRYHNSNYTFDCVEQE